MRILLPCAVCLAGLLAGCSSEPPKPAPSPAPETRAAAPKPLDETHRFPKTDMADSKVVDKELMGKSFMPGGTVVHYKKGKTEYDMFVCQLASPTAAAVLLPDWRKALADSRFEASFGGYFGQDAGKPVFVFAKGAWIAGISGLPEKQADLAARTLAVTEAGRTRPGCFVIRVATAPAHS